MKRVLHFSRQLFFVVEDYLTFLCKETVYEPIFTTVYQDNSYVDVKQNKTNMHKMCHSLKFSQVPKIIL